MLLSGAAIKIGDREWTVPPLTLGQLRRLWPELERISAPAGMVDGEVVGAIIKIITAALQRNYPDLGADAVEEMLDLGNAGAVLNAVLTGSGLERSAKAGEDKAAVGDGTKSTVSSPPPSAIARATSTS